MKSRINTVDIPVPEEMTNKWQSIVNIMAEIINVPAGLIMKVEPPYIEVFRSSESRNNPYKVGSREHLAGLYCEAVISTRHKLIVPNALKDGDWNKNPDIKLGMISYLGFPLLWPDGEVFGTICVLDSKENSYGERYEKLMIQFKEVVEAHLALLYQNQLLKNHTEELKRARNAVQESKERYGTLVTNAPIGLSIIAKDGTYEYVNPKFVEMFGYTLDDVPTGKKWFEKAYPDPEYRQKVIACWIEDLQGAKVGEMRPRTFTVTCNDGSKKEIFFRPATMTDGRQLVTYEDITERKRAEEALRESEERFRQLAENIREVFWMTDPGKRKMVYVSPAYEEIWGRTCESLYEQPRSFLDSIHPEDREAVIATSEKQAQGKPISVEYRIMRPDGSVRWIQSRGFPVRNELGEIYRIVGLAEDITERKQAEGALRESKELFEKTFKSQRDAIYLLDAEIPPKILDGNPAATEIFGYTREEMLGRPTSFLHIDETTLKEFQEYVYPAVAVGGFAHLPEFEMKRKDGQVFPTEHTVIPLTNEQGMRIGWVSVVRDITDRKQAEEALQREKQAVQRLADEREVLANIGRIIGSTLEIEEVYELFAEEVHKLIPFDRISIYTISPEKSTCIPAYIIGQDVPGRRSGDVVPLANSLTEEVMRTRSNQLIQVDDIDEVVGRFPRLLPILQAGLRSLMSVPLISKDQVIGVLHLRSVTPKAYTAADVELAESIGAQIAGAIANAQLYKELKNQWVFSTTLIDTMSDGLGVLDEKGQLEFGNRRLFQMLGSSSEETMGMHWTSLIHPNDHSLVRAQGKPRKKGQSSTYECHLLRKGRVPIPVLISSAPRFDDQGQHKGIVEIVTDITERKRAEERLREYEARYSHLLDHLPDGVALIQRGRIIRANQPMAQMFDFPSPTKMEGLHVWDLAAPGSKGIMRQRASLKAIRQKPENRFEFQALRKDGQAFSAEATLTIDRREPEAFVLAIIRDVTDRKSYENQRKRLSDRIITAQERERTLIARELHDELGQALTGIKMDMAWIKSHIKDSDAPVLDRLKALGELIDTTIESVGRMATNLRPSALDRLGLAAAVEWYGGEFERRTGIECIIESEASDSNLDNKTAINAYRIFQEALTNVARHAGASRVIIRVARNQEYLQISIADNGRSIPPQRLSGPMSLGIAGMRERAELLNGRLDIESQKGKGTKVIAYLPLIPEGGIV